jgi:hypothetical protein
MVNVLALCDWSRSCQTKDYNLGKNNGIDNEFEYNFLEPCNNITE